MNYYKPGMTFLDRTMIDFLDTGKDNAVIADDLVLMFGENDFDNRMIRLMIRNLTIEYHIPIASGNTGFYIVENAEERDEYIANLKAKIKGTSERLHHFEIACGMNPIEDSQIGIFDANKLGE